MTGCRKPGRWKNALLAIAIAMATAVTLGWGQQGAEAAGDAPDLYVDVLGVPGCTTDRQPPPAAPGDVQCNISQGTQFTVRGFLSSIDGLPDLDKNGTAGYAGAQFRLLYTAGLTRVDLFEDTEFGPSGAPYWPDCAFRTELPASGEDLLVCLMEGLDGSTFLGKIIEMGFSCSAVGQATITLDDAQSHLHNEIHGPALEKDGDEVLTINCLSAAAPAADSAPLETAAALGRLDGDPNDLPNAGRPAQDPGSSTRFEPRIVAAAIAASTAAAIALGAAAWYARRRRVR
jgi:hypothetical protein